MQKGKIFKAVSKYSRSIQLIDRDKEVINAALRNPCKKIKISVKILFKNLSRKLKARTGRVTKIFSFFS